MNHTPLNLQKSPWTELKNELPIDGQAYHRSVRDGHLFAIVANEPDVGWHMSISFRNHNGLYTRYPTWDELAHAREELLPEHFGFAIHFPPLVEYVNAHPTTFHLYQEGQHGSI